MGCTWSHSGRGLRCLLNRYTNQKDYKRNGVIYFSDSPIHIFIQQRGKHFENKKIFSSIFYYWRYVFIAAHCTCVFTFLYPPGPGHKIGIFQYINIQYRHLNERFLLFTMGTRSSDRQKFR